MSAPKAYYQDLSKYTLSATSTDTAYPLANLQTYFARDQWKSNSLAANQSLVIDFGAAVAIDFCVIENHNLATSHGSGNIYLQGADDSGFTTNAVNAVTDLTTAVTPKLFVFAAITRRYWRLYFDSTGNLGAKPEIGNLFLGAALAFGSEYEFGAKRDNAGYATTRAAALDGSLRTAQAIGGRKRFELQFTVQDNTFATAFRTFHETVRGGLRPFYFLDADGTTMRYVLAPDYSPIVADRYNKNSLQSLVLETQLASW
jgi:hypothetical protein